MSILDSGIAGGMIMFGIFCTEISNFPMHMRLILKNYYGLRHTLIYECFEMWYFILYVFGRLLCSPRIFWETLPIREIPVMFKLGSLFMLLQSCHFMIKMYAIVKARLQ